jgi:hypothetical protein
MPRSNTNWPSRQRIAFIEDSLATQGYINRQALMDYFGVERSLGSMDITAYRQMGGKLRQASAGEVLRDGTAVVGHKLGGLTYWVPEDDWTPVAGTTEVRQRAWALLPRGGYNHQEWLRRVYDAWIADHGRDADHLAAYFGISATQAKRLIDGAATVPNNGERAGVWGVLA